MSRVKSIVAFLVMALTFLCASRLGAQAAGYSEYYLPGDELHMYYIFTNLDANGTGNTGMHSVTSVVAWTPNTTVYYDHWENGYNFDPANPGATADESQLLATAGSIRTFESSNVPSGGPPPAARNPAATCPGQGNPGDRCYDGGDRLYVAGGPVTVTRAVWLEAYGAGNQGDAWEIYPVQPQLTTYILPFGENNYAASATFFTGFERVYALVQATDDNTTFTVDKDGNGTADMLNINRNAILGDAGDAASVTLQRGQAWLLDRVTACTAGANCTTTPGTLNSGATIIGTKTLQVKFITGRVGTTYAARGLSAFPRGFWTEDYYAPFGQLNAAGRNTDYYLFNPHATPLTINWQSQTATGSFAIPANSTESFNRALGANPSVPLGAGLYLSAAQPFWGVGFGDSTGQAFEWGYSLLPTSFLYDEHFLGWSPGSVPLTTAPTNGNGIFLTVAQDNTVVFVDYQNDGVADLTNNLDRLEQWFISPGTSGTLEGARIWATGEFSMAWGENADTATTPTPNLDLGYVALPGTDFISLALTVDKSANPVVIPTASGSTTQFTISTKSRLYSMNGVGVVDTLPPNWQYVAGTTTITRPDNTTLTAAAANPTITGAGTAANPYVLTWSAAQTGGAMLPNQEIRIVFTAQTTAAFTIGTLSQNRVVSTGTRTVGSPAVVQTFTATDFAYVVTGNVQITKTSSAATPLYPGDAFTYTVTVTNPAAAGTNLLTGVSLYDQVPNGVTTTAGSASISRSTVGDSFNTQSFALNVGTRNWAAAWAENDTAGAGAAAGDIQVTAGGELRFDNSNSNEPTLSRAVSLTGATQARLAFRFRTDTGVDAADEIRVLGGTGGTGGAFGTTIATITGITGATTAASCATAGGNWVAPSSCWMSFDISALIGANTAIRFTMPTGDYEGGTEFMYVDDISITYNVAVTGPNPPDLTSASSLYALVGGQTIVVTYNVTVDNPFPTGQTSVTNTAATTSVQIPLQLTASVTNNVTVPSVLSASVAGRMWLDANWNGIQDVGEGGIDNVTVTLKDSFGTPIATEVTDSNGRFLFTGVAAGNGYYVESTAPPNPNSYPTGLVQSFPVGFTNDRTTTFNLAAGQNYNQANLGYTATATTAVFGDLVWVDTNSNLTRDAGEIGLGGVTLNLYKDANGNGVLNIGTDTLVATTVSAADGSYLFTGVTPGVAGTDTYFVAATTPAGYTATTATSVRFQNVQQGGVYVSADFGYVSIAATFSITDRVWYDANGNGAFAAETGIGGVTVELLDGASNVIGTTTTAADGTFSFTGLPGGGADYKTRITDAANVLADYYATTAFAVALERAETNLVASVNRAAAPSYGFNITRSIGDQVFIDLNASGAQDAGEPGLGGVVVSLYRDTNGNGQINAGEPLVGTVTTDSNGLYLFTGLTNASYIVSLPTPAGYNYFAGGRPDTDAGTAGIQLAAVIAAGANVLTRDFGFQAATPRTVSGKLWNDANRNGVVNAGENGFSGVSVQVLSVTAGGGTVGVTNNSSTVTGSGFSTLNPGDPILLNGVPYLVQSIASNTSLTLARGYTGATNGALAWSRVSGVVATTTTNATGDYTFTGLPSATHIVRVTDTDAILTGYGATFEIAEGLITVSNPANFVEAVALGGGNVAGVNFGYVQLALIPTLVQLRSFEAAQDGTTVRLNWQTEFETRNLGFNVYRDAGGTRTQINKTLIAGSSLITRRNAPLAGYSYHFTDRLSSEDQFVQYWLEDVDTAGRRTMRGPVTPSFTSASKVRGDGLPGAAVASDDSMPLAGLGADGNVIANATGVGVVRPTTLGNATNAQLTAQLALAGGSALKIYIAKEGWYRITRDQIVAAGFNPGSNASSLSLWCEGVEQPIVVSSATPNVFATGDSIEFYGLDLDTPATGARTYWLRANGGNGARLAPIASSAGSPLSGSVPFVYQRIDRSVYATTFLDLGDGESFFGPVITTEPATQDLIVANHDASSATPAKLELTIRGVTEGVEHGINVAINGHSVSTAAVANSETLTFSWDIAHAWLVQGPNTIALAAQGGDDDVSVLVSARLTYQHLLRADDGLFEAELPASRQVTIGGFPNNTIRALDITDALAPKELAVAVSADGAAFAATFTTPAGSGNRTILVFSSNRVLTAAELAPNGLSDFATRAATLRADLVILTHQRFSSAAESLAVARRAGGLDAVVVDIEDIYDEYNFGVRSPFAIRSFLQASRTWNKAPEHVVLVGDASIDPRGYLELGLIDYIPTKLVSTDEMRTASDGWFVDLTESGVEDLAIGRLPVQTEAQAATVVGKITSRGVPSGTWSQKSVMVADVPDTWNFEGSVQTLKSLLPETLRPSAQVINVASTPNPRDAILSAMNDGSLFVDYAGHGSVGIWNHQVFNDTDAAALTNGGRLPFVAAMTCLNGYFHDLYAPSLAEALLTAPNGGAVAVWASSSLTEPGPQMVMNQELMRQIFTNGVTIGQAIRRAKLVTSDENVRRSWILFGDPSMTLRSPCPDIASSPITAADTACSSTAANQASVAPRAGVTHEWTISSGTITSSQIGDAITFTAPSSGTATLTVTARQACATGVTTKTLEILAPPSAPAITAPASVCGNAIGTSASVAALNGTTYEWSISGGTISSSNTGDSITFTAGASGTVTLTVTESRCGTTVQSSKNVPISAPAGASVTGATIVRGNPAQLRVDLTGSAPWSVKWRDIPTAVVVNSTPYLRDVSPSTTTTYWVDAVTAASCPVTVNASAVVRVLPLSPTSVVATTRPNQSRVVDLSWSDDGPATTYQIERTTLVNGVSGLVVGVDSNAYVDTLPESANPITYIYYVRTVENGETSARGRFDYATTATTLYQQPAIVAGETVVKASDVVELRRAVDSVRAAAGLPPVFGSTPPPTGLIRAADFAALVSPLQAAQQQLGYLPLFTYSIPPATDGIIRRTHVTEIREALR